MPAPAIRPAATAAAAALHSDLAVQADGAAPRIPPGLLLQLVEAAVAANGSWC